MFLYIFKIRNIRLSSNNAKHSKIEIVTYGKDFVI